jgi:segregation and condensation protein B
VTVPSFDARLIEALLFAAPEPLDEAALKARLPETADLAALLAELKAHYAERGVNLAELGGRWQFRTAPDLGSHLKLQVEVRRKLSRAAVETLAIIAYHQPITRAEIEEVRGVGLSRGTLDLLLEAGFIRPRGHREAPGRPALWVTTDMFLEHFGLASLDDLPGLSDLKASGLLDQRGPLPAMEQVADAVIETDPDDEPEPDDAEGEVEEPGSEGASDDAEPARDAS